MNRRHKMKKAIYTAAAASLFLFPYAQARAVDITIDQYPKTVAAGQAANLRISWSGHTLNDEYIMRVQLQDSEAVPPIFVFNDYGIDKSEGTAEIALKIPLNVTASKSAKFVAAFISKTKIWDDILYTADTGSAVEIVSDFKFALHEYPTLVSRGEIVKVKVGWKGIKADKRYKLIVQLENWQVKPGFAYVSRIDDFGPEGEAELTIKVPESAPEAKACRFVAAFISKEKNWQDAYAITATPGEVDIVKHKPL